MTFRRAIYLCIILCSLIFIAGALYICRTPSDPNAREKRKLYTGSVVLNSNIRKYFVESKAKNFDSIYLEDGSKFNFIDGKTKWYELVDLFSRPVYSENNGRQFGPYFDHNYDYNSGYKPNYQDYIGYKVLLYEDETTFSEVYVFPVKSESENNVSIERDNNVFVKTCKENNVYMFLQKGKSIYEKLFGTKPPRIPFVDNVFID